MKYRFDESAIEDARAAVSFYARERRELGVRFVGELYDAVLLLTDNPYLGHEVTATHRRWLLRRFPFAVFYRIDSRADVIHIVAVVAQRRGPGAWRSRVEEPVPAYVAIRRAA